MTIAFGSAGTKNIPATTAATLAVAYPAGIVAGDMLILVRSLWLAPSATFTLPAGWTRAANGSGGTGSASDSHTTLLTIDHKIAVGTESGTLATASSVAPGGLVGQMFRYTKGSGTWSIQVSTTTADDATHAADRATASVGAFDVAVDDVMVAAAAVDTDASLTISAQSIVTTGATGTATRRTSGVGASAGVDGNLELFDRTTTSGSAAAVAASLTFTTATTQCGPAGFLRLREVSSSTPKAGSDSAAGADTSVLATALTATDARTILDAGTLAATAALATDTATAANTASVGVTATDTASVANSATLATAITGTDGASSVASTVIGLTSAELASVTDLASTAVPPTAGDFASTTDIATVGVTGTDTASGTDAAIVEKTLTADDSAASIDEVTSLGVIPDSDTATATESATLATTGSAADTGATADSADLEAAYSVGDSDPYGEGAYGARPYGVTAVTAEAVDLGVLPAVGDTATASDVSTLAVSFTVTDTGTGTETAAVLGGSASVIASDTGHGVESATVAVLLAATDTASAAELADVDVVDVGTQPPDQWPKTIGTYREASRLGSHAEANLGTYREPVADRHRELVTIGGHKEPNT